MTTSIDDITSFGESLMRGHADVEARVTAFPSGAAMLDVRKGDRAFVMSYSPERGFGVDELAADDGFLANYRHTFTDFAAAARRLREIAAAPAAAESPSLSLIVLHVRDIDAAKDFYSLLGLAFNLEQHGSGPRHYAATLGGIVFELYPCRAGQLAAPVRFGFRVAHLGETLERLRDHGARVVNEPRDTPWGRRALIEDADGNRVELSASA